MKRILVFSTVAAVLFAGLALAASAHPRSGRSHERGAMRELGLRFWTAVERLELTDQQSQKLKDIRRAAPGKIMPKKQAVVESRLDLHDLLQDEGADTNALRRAHKKMADAQAALKEAQFDLRLAVREVLTPEQRKEMRERPLRGRRSHERRMLRGLRRDSDSELHF